MCSKTIRYLLVFTALLLGVGTLFSVSTTTPKIIEDQNKLELLLNAEQTESINPQPIKVNILMVDNRFGVNTNSNLQQIDETEYYQQSSLINLKYAKKWNYKNHFIAYQDGMGRNFVSKLEAIKEYFDFVKDDDVDWIFYIDSDAFFNRFDWSIDDVLKKFNVNSDKHILIENERPFRRGLYLDYNGLCPSSGLSKDTVSNTGVFMIRNSKMGQKIVHEWYDSLRKKMSDLERKWPGDQGVFNCLITAKYHEHIAYDDTQYFVNFSGELEGGYRDGFVQHYWTGDVPARKREIKRFLKEKLKDSTVARKTKDRGMPFTIYSYADVYI